MMTMTMVMMMMIKTTLRCGAAYQMVGDLLVQCPSPLSRCRGEQQAKSTNEDGEELYEGCNHDNDDNDNDNDDYDEAKVHWSSSLGRSSKGRNRPREQMKMVMKYHYDHRLTDADNVVKECFCPDILFVYFQPMITEALCFQIGGFLEKFQTACDFRFCNPKMHRVTP